MISALGRKREFGRESMLRLHSYSTFARRGLYGDCISRISQVAASVCQEHP